MQVPHGIIGMVHVPPLPGDPNHDGESSFEDVLEFALSDAEALVAGGVDGLIVENFGSAPFVKGTDGERLPPHQVAFLTRIAGACASRFDVDTGVNCLRNDAPAAVGIAAAAGLDFIRVNVHTGAYLTDQGIIEGEAHRTLRYREQLEAADVSILADVLVKHARPLTEIDPEAAVEDCVQRGLADGVIVTGRATGAPADAEFLRRVGDAAGDTPMFIGSGVTPENITDFAPVCDAAIVGTYFKEGGDVRAPVAEGRVRQLVEESAL